MKDKGLEKARSIQKNQLNSVNKYYRENIDSNLLPSIQNTRTLMGDVGINGFSLH